MLFQYRGHKEVVKFSKFTDFAEKRKRMFPFPSSPGGMRPRNKFGVTEPGDSFSVPAVVSSWQNLACCH